MSGTLGTVALPPPMVFLSDTREDVVSSVIQPSPPGYNTGSWSFFFLHQ